MDVLKKYFAELSSHQIELFTRLKDLYEEWNQKVNVISRKDMEAFYLHHVLHSLSFCKVAHINAGCKVLDVGTGGGFPGIPLAIMYPDVSFTLVDSIAKKIMVVRDVADILNLKNITPFVSRVEAISGSFDFIFSRAVAPTDTIISWTKRLYNADSDYQYAGYWLYKGGDLSTEISQAGIKKYELIPVSQFFVEPFFKEKYLLHFNFQ